MPGVKLVFMTMTKAADVAAEAFRCGASAYVLKQSAGDELLLAIRKVNQGASYLSPLIVKETVTYLLNQEENFSEEKHITKRQGEILQLLAEGMSMKEVANVIVVGRLCCCGSFPGNWGRSKAPAKYTPCVCRSPCHLR
jgi:DNA-binding NarL/FixJ family response regulator